MISWGEMVLHPLKGHRTYSVRGTLRLEPDGPRVQRYFRTLEEAEAAKNDWEATCKAQGVAALPPKRSAELAFLAGAAKREGHDPGAVFRAGLEVMRRENSGVSLLALVGHRLEQIRSESRSPVHIGVTEGRLNRFASDFGDREAAGITTSEISAWLRGLGEEGLSEETLINYRASLRALFELGVKLEFFRRNPVIHCWRPKRSPAKKGLLTPDQARELLAAADADLKAGLAIALFAGVRVDSELPHLTAADYVNGQLRIQVSKTRPHAVPVEGNLQQWLSVHLTGFQVWPKDGKERMKEFRKTLSFPWPKNAMRHSYGSYWMALFADAARLAEHMGNSPAVIKSNYQALVSPESAREYFSIRP